MKYTDEILKTQLMHCMGYSASQAEQLIERYRCNCELDDLVAAVEEKEKACSRL